MLNKIEVYRRKAGLKQKELAARCGISESVMSRVSAGGADMPGFRWKMVADALGVTVDELWDV